MEDGGAGAAANGSQLAAAGCACKLGAAKGSYAGAVDDDAGGMELLKGSTPNAAAAGAL
jgi:hypothetical protein